MTRSALDTLAVAVPASPPRTARLTALARRLYAHAGLWSAASQGLASVMSLAISVFAARLLGIDEFGEFVLIAAGTAIICVLQHQYITAPMMIVVGLRTRGPAYFAELARLLLASGLASGAVIALYVALLTWWNGGVRGPLLVGAFLYAAGFCLNDGMKRLLFAQGQPQRACLYEVLRYGLFAALLAASWLGLGAHTAVLLVCAGVAPILVSLFVILPMMRGRPGRRFRATLMGRHWVLGRWMMLMVFVTMFYEHAVTIIVGASISEAAAGGLRAAQVLFSPLLVLVSSLENIVPRRAAASFAAGGKDAAARYLRRTGLLCEIPVLAVCILMVLFSRQVLGFVLGRDYEAFGTLATIIAAIPPVILAREMGMIYLRTVEGTRDVFFAFAISGLVTALAVFPLIHLYGVTGAALTLLLGQIVSTTLVLLRASRG